MKREQCPLVIGLSLQSDTRRQLIRRDHSNNWENRIPPENLSSADKRIRKSRLKEEILVLFRIQISSLCLCVFPRLRLFPPRSEREAVLHLQTFQLENNFRRG